MEQELLTLVFSGIRISRSLVFCEKFVDLVCLFILFLLTIALSFLLLLTFTKTLIMWPIMLQK